MTMQEERNPLLEMFADLKLTLGSLNGELQQQRKRWNPSKANQPVLMTIHGSIVMGSSGYGTIGFDNQPDQGTIWFLRRLLVGGDTVSDTPNGRADVFVTASPLGQFTSLAQIGMADWVDSTTTLPNIAFYGMGEIPLRNPERLRVVISGGTNLQQYVATGIVQVHQEAALQQEWSL